MFRSRETGRITVAQWPNPPLWIYIAAVALRRVVPSSGAAPTVVHAVGSAALAWWAVAEVLQGVNPWRRLLGVAGCAFAMAGLITLVH